MRASSRATLGTRMTNISSDTPMTAHDLAAPAAAPRDPAARHMPGEEGVWVLIFGDMMMFSLLFIVFLYYRRADPALFAQAQTHMNQAFGALNTVLMLSSSWFVAMAVRAARLDMRRTTTHLLQAAMLCGAGFGVVKFFEYAEKIRHGITLSTNDFFMYYFIFTGIHMMHVVIATGVLFFLTRHIRGGPIDARRLRNVESGASFWHVVDLLWIVLFALFYLIR